MPASTLAWTAVIAYALLTLGLAIRGALRTKSLEGFAVGNGDIHPALIGLSLTAQLTSVATFVINPGLVFHSGVSGLLGYGVAAAAGITLGLIVFTARFRAVGAKVAALTVPSWIGARYEAPHLRALFTLLSLGLVAFAVLIVVALALVLSGLLGVAPVTLAVVLTAFVVGTLLIGGANGHALTNAVQAMVMLVVAVVLIAAGLPLFTEGEGLLATLAAQDPQLLTVVNPSSLYFRNLFEVFVCNFLVGLAVVCQPHIVGKALYLREDRQVRTFLSVAVVAGMVFLGVLLVGLYARTAVPLDTRIDLVVPTWIGATFSGPMQVLISIGMLCAGMSTLEGILLALSGIFALDLHPLLGGKDPKAALRFGKAGLVVVALVTVALAARQIADPVGGSVAIFAQYGVYLLFTASFLPLACGMFLPTVGRGAVTFASLAAIAGYLGASVFELTMLSSNPAFLATIGIGCGWTVVGVALAVQKRAPQPAAAAQA